MYEVEFPDSYSKIQIVIIIIEWLLWVYKGAMAVSTRHGGVHKHSSPARSMLDDPQQSAQSTL